MSTLTVRPCRAKSRVDCRYHGDIKVPTVYIKDKAVLNSAARFGSGEYDSASTKLMNLEGISNEGIIDDSVAITLAQDKSMFSSVTDMHEFSKTGQGDPRLLLEEITDVDEYGLREDGKRLSEEQKYAAKSLKRWAENVFAKRQPVDEGTPPVAPKDPYLDASGVFTGLELTELDNRVRSLSNDAIGIEDWPTKIEGVSAYLEVSFNNESDLNLHFVRTTDGETFAAFDYGIAEPYRDQNGIAHERLSQKLRDKKPIDYYFTIAPHLIDYYASENEQYNDSNYAEIKTLIEDAVKRL